LRVEYAEGCAAEELGRRGERSLVAETMRRVFADRAAYLADPDYSNVPVAGLTDPCYAKELAETIDAQRASSSKEVRAGKPHNLRGCWGGSGNLHLGKLGGRAHTTHFSVVDEAGNAVASTYTLNDSYGSHVTVRQDFCSR